jgi:microcystin-dependent protein
MSEPFLAEVKILGFNFAPRGFALCDGQILPINQNQALFSLLGTNYGGDGRTTFGLPDLRGRTPIHHGNGHTLGQKSGEEQHALNVNEMASHSHSCRGSTSADTDDPAGSFPGLTEDATYNSGAGPTLVNMGTSTITNAGAGQGHQNMQPFLVLYFAIALQGLFPSRN